MPAPANDQQISLETGGTPNLAAPPIRTPLRADFPDVVDLDPRTWGTAMRLPNIVSAREDLHHAQMLCQAIETNKMMGVVDLIRSQQSLLGIPTSIVGFAFVQRQTSENIIPRTLAEHLHLYLRTATDIESVVHDGISHSQRSPTRWRKTYDVRRFALMPTISETFSSPEAEQCAAFIVVDDSIDTGRAVAHYIDHFERSGRRVLGVIGIDVNRYAVRLPQSEDTARLLQEKIAKTVADGDKNSIELFLGSVKGTRAESVVTDYLEKAREIKMFASEAAYTAWANGVLGELGLSLEVLTNGEAKELIDRRDLTHFLLQVGALTFSQSDLTDVAM